MDKRRLALGLVDKKTRIGIFIDWLCLSASADVKLRYGVNGKVMEALFGDRRSYSSELVNEIIL